MPILVAVHIRVLAGGRQEVLRFLAVSLLISLLIGLPWVSSLSAQGLQTGILSGIVKDPDGLPVPGASVTVTSPALQGTRTTSTDVIGAYIVRDLPPGTYAIRFESTGAAIVEQIVEVPLGGLVKVDLTLSLAIVQEAVTVAAVTLPPLATTQQSTNFTADVIGALPIGRRPFEIAELAPGVTDNTPNVGQMAIAGAFGFDSLFLVDGVDTNDNLFGYSHGLFIEDAIHETQVLTSGISAEYGRFSGGVVNVITRSGGNSFSGSFRSNLAKPSWTDETPFERERSQKRSDQLSRFHEATFGGPILRDGSVLQRRSIRELGNRQCSVRDRHAVYRRQQQHAVRTQADGHHAGCPHTEVQRHVSEQSDHTDESAEHQSSILHGSGNADGSGTAQ